MTEAEHIAIEGRALLLYDGVCALCNGLVSLLLRHDKLEKLCYAPLQSALGREILAHLGQHSLPNGVVLLTDTLTLRERFYFRSDAVAAALQLLSTPWRILGKVLTLVPIPSASGTMASSHASATDSSAAIALVPCQRRTNAADCSACTNNGRFMSQQRSAC